MSCFRNIFRKKKDTTWIQQSMEKLQDTQDLLLKQQEDLKKKIEGCVLTARKNAKINRREAFTALQMKKRLERKLRQINNLLTTLEMQKNELEKASVNAALMLSLKNGSKLKRLKKLGSDKQHKIINDITEQYCMVNEISTTIRKSFLPDLSDEELAIEFEKLEVELQKNDNNASETTKLATNPRMLKELGKKSPTTDKIQIQMLQADGRIKLEV